MTSIDNKKQVKSKQRVADHGEVFTNQPYNARYN